MKRAALAGAVLVSTLLSGVAVASVVTSSQHSPNPSRGGSSGHVGSSEIATSIHGGSIDRFHGSDSCTLTSVAALPGNWTHGDYVSTVAVTGDSMLIVEAAHSDCGKPMVSVSHGTDHAMLKTEKHESTPGPGS